MTYLSATATKRRQPRELPEKQQLLQRIRELEARLEEVVLDTNRHIKAVEARADETIRLSQQAQVDADNKVLYALNESVEQLLAENEQLRARIAELEAGPRPERVKPKVKRKERRHRERWQEAESEE